MKHGGALEQDRREEHSNYVHRRRRLLTEILLNLNNEIPIQV